MKYTPGFTDFFISPVTGKFITNTLIPLKEDYILVGDRNDFSIPSPALIDVKLNIIALRGLLANARFLIQKAKKGLGSSQALNLVRNGMISNSNGVIVPTTLTHNYFWIGDENNFPIETNIIPSGVLPDLPYGTAWIGNILNRPTSTGLSKNKIFIGDSFNKIIETGLTAKQLLYGNPDNSGEIIKTVVLNIDNLPNLTLKRLWIGNGSNRPQETLLINLDNLPDLPFDNVWIGDIFGRPQPSQIISESNLPDLSDGHFWLGNPLDRPSETLFQINTGTGLIGGPIAGNGTISIDITGVSPGTYNYATITVNAQGQLTSAASNTPPDGTVTQVNTGAGLTGGPITTTGTVSMLPTGIAPLTYAYATVTVNVRGQLTAAFSNATQIQDMTDSITTINEALFGPGGIVPVLVPVVTALAPLVPMVGGLLILPGIVSDLEDQVEENTTNIATNTTNIAINTTNIATNSDTIAGIIAGTVPIDANFTGIGDVSGSGPLSSDITLTLNTTLNNVPLATGNVDLNNFAIYNLADIGSDLHNDYLNGQAINFDWFLNVFNDNVTLPGFSPQYIFPTIELTGQTQKFQFQEYQSLSQFQLSNIYTPIANNAQQNCFEMSNSNSSGFRFRQITSNSATFGDLNIESFVNDTFPGTSIITFQQSGNILMIPPGSTGNIGINQSSPLAKLHVSGGVQNIVNEDTIIRATSSSNVAKIELQCTNSSGRQYEFHSNNGGNFVIYDRPAAASRFFINSSGQIGLGNVTTPHAALQFSNVVTNRQLVLYEAANNDFQFHGFGSIVGGLGYNVNITADSHVFFAGVNSTTRNELARIDGTANLYIGSSGSLRFRNSNATQYVGFRAGTLSSSILWTLPTADSSGTQALVSNGAGSLSWQSLVSGTVTSVSGTVNRITVINGTTTPVVDISASYVGQTSIVTLGTVTTGDWRATITPQANLNMNSYAIYNMASIDDDLYGDYLAGQAVNLDWFMSFLNDEVI